MIQSLLHGSREKKFCIASILHLDVRSVNCALISLITAGTVTEHAKCQKKVLCLRDLAYRVRSFIDVHST